MMTRWLLLFGLASSLLFFPRTSLETAPQSRLSSERANQERTKKGATRAASENLVKFQSLVQKNAGKLPIESELSPGRLEKVIEQGELYLEAYGEKGDAEGEEAKRKRKSLFRECLLSPQDNPFCLIIGSPIQKRAEVEKQNLTFPPPQVEEDSSEEASVQEILQAVRLRRIEGYAKASRSQALRVLNYVHQESPTQKLAKKLLERWRCPTAGSLAALGMKLEEFFPEKEKRDLAKKLYSRAIECGEEKKELRSIEIARFRLGLLRIWDKEWVQAEKILRPLSDDPTRAYFSRSLYWRAQCAETLGRDSLYEHLRGKLFQANPLGYHTLRIAPDKVFSLVNEMNQPSFQVLTASQKVAKLMPYIRATEVLLKEEKKNLAKKLIKRLEPLFEKTEPLFQIYTAFLAYQADDWIRQFRLLAGVFRGNPELVNRQVLKYFVPQKHFDLLKGFSGPGGAYLLSAIIRQESGFDPEVQSSAGARGLMQLMYHTARRYQRIAPGQLYDAKINVRIGKRYLKDLLQDYEGDVELALAAYNAGPDHVDSWLERYPVENRSLFLDLIPFGETRNYIALIARNYFWYVNVYRPEELELSDSKGLREIASQAQKRVFKSMKFD